MAGLANVVEFDAGVTSHVEQLGSAWAMVTDGVSFFPEFAYTGKPLLLTQAPGNPGWNPVGRAIEGVVRTSLVADGQVPGLAEFLDEVERGVDAEEVERRQRAVREILGRPEGGAAPRIADHLEQVRASHRARPSRARRSAPPRLPDDVLAAVEALNEWDAPRVGRTYQRMLLESGRLAWIDGSVVAQTFPHEGGHAGSPAVLADGTVLLTGALHEGWPIDRVLIGGTVYSALGASAGNPLGAAADVLGAGHAHRLSEAVPADGPRTLWIGVRGVWHDLWNQLPALVHWEPLLADLIAAGELVARVDDGARAQLESLAPLHRLLPLLAPSIPGSARGVPPVGSVRCSSTWVSDAAASRVRSWLSSEPVLPRPRPGNPRLWVGLGNDDEAPRDVVEVAAQIAVLWHGSTGGDTVIHTWSPDDAEREQPWMRPRIDAANRLRAAALARATSLGAPVGSVLTTEGLDLGAALAWMGSADFHVSCGGDSARGPVWLAGLRGVLLLGSGEHRQSVSDWYRDQAEQPPALEPSPAAMVVDADGGWRSSDPAELAAWALSRYRAVT